MIRTRGLRWAVLAMVLLGDVVVLHCTTPAILLRTAVPTGHDDGMTALLNVVDALRYRIRHGRWCRHAEWGSWHLADAGRFKCRTCHGCGRWESTRSRR